MKEILNCSEFIIANLNDDNIFCRQLNDIPTYKIELIWDLALTEAMKVIKDCINKPKGIIPNSVYNLHCNEEWITKHLR